MELTDVGSSGQKSNRWSGLAQLLSDVAGSNVVRRLLETDKIGTDDPFWLVVRNLQQ